MISILLWSIIILYSFHLSGHLHNMLTNVPNWSSGSVEDMNRYKAFYHKVTNTRFFAPVIFATIIICIISLFVVWNHSSFTRYLVLLCLLIAVAVLIAVFTVFRPMNEYFLLKQCEPLVLKKMVKKWLTYNYIRFFIILIGLIISIWNLASFKS